jgi:hypothetical protein
LYNSSEDIYSNCAINEDIQLFQKVENQVGVLVRILGIVCTAFLKWVGMANQGTFVKDMNVGINHLVYHHGSHDEQQNEVEQGFSCISQ